MLDDPIVDEVRRIRREYAERFNNDVHAICEDLRRQERESDREFRTPLARKRNDAEERVAEEKASVSAGGRAAHPLVLGS